MGDDTRLTVVGIRGDDSFLIMKGNDPQTAEGIVADRRHQERYKSVLFQSIIARGYWQEHKHDKELLDELMSFKEV